MTLIVSVTTPQWGVLAGDGRTTDRITKEVQGETAIKIVRLSQRSLYGTCGSVAYSSAMRDAVLKIARRLDPPPEAEFKNFLNYVRILASEVWRQDPHPEDETLGMVIVGFDSVAGRIRAVSTDHVRSFEWEEDHRKNLQIHWLGPANDVREIVQRWFRSNETHLSRGPSFAVAALEELFADVAASDSTVNTQIVTEQVYAPGV
jgi:hypothetical protein